MASFCGEEGITDESSVDFKVDMSTSYLMMQNPIPKDKTVRQIVGFSLSPEQASAVKVEAARRGISLKKLFEEMWSLYSENNKQNEH
jgi:hypothetical protein